MPKLTVNGIEVEVEDGSTVLHACEAVSYTHLTLPTMDAV